MVCFGVKSLGDITVSRILRATRRMNSLLQASTWTIPPCNAIRRWIFSVSVANCTFRLLTNQHSTLPRLSCIPSRSIPTTFIPHVPGRIKHPPLKYGPAHHFISSAFNSANRSFSTLQSRQNILQSPYTPPHASSLQPRRSAQTPLSPSAHRPARAGWYHVRASSWSRCSARGLFY